MKKLCLSIMLGLFGITVVCAQEKAPELVQKSFNEKFPQAKSVKWEMENSNEWEAEFKLNGKKMSATFDMKGAWLETETELKMSELPAAVGDAIKTKFVGYKAEEPEMLELVNGEIAYEVALEKGQEELEVIFAADGTVKSKKQEQEEEDEH